MDLVGGSFDDEAPVRDRWWKVAAGDVVIDVGANEGSYVMPALAAGAARVYAFNPGEPDAAMLQRNLDANGFADRCEVIRLAVGDGPGWFSFELSMLFNEEAPGRTRATSLDDWMAGRSDIQRVDWIKIDVEGAEERVIRGAEGLIRRFRPRMIVENHQFMDNGIEGRVRELVLGLGLGYTVDGAPWHSVSHSFFEARP